MSLWKLHITTPWATIIDPDGGNNTTAKISTEYTIGWVDITGQSYENITPAPNTFNIEAIVPYSLVDIIKADPDYLVWYEEEIINAIP